MITPTERDGKLEIVLDLSRLLSRILYSTPTGVDRVEMAYARHLLAQVGFRLSFAAVHPIGLYGRLSRRAVLGFLDRTEAAWEGRLELPKRGLRRWLHLLKTLWVLRPRALPTSHGTRVIIQSSPHHLHRENLVRNILRREGAAFACFVHDLIPIEFPEYARPGGAALHARRIATIERHASLAIANSTATHDAFLRHTRHAGTKRSVVAPLGIEHPVTAAASRASPQGACYFVCVGTIEPRKNHLLLLNLWRALAAERRSNFMPRLLVIGRRGWENEQVIDMLERCPSLTEYVEELNGLSDEQVRMLIAGARALLLPSFAEGFGMPVTEALGSGVPVICSDLPALREAGGNVPEFLDPLDGPSWAAAIKEYAVENSPRRAAQLDRLTSWHAPSWNDHMCIVVDAIREIT